MGYELEISEVGPAEYPLMEVLRDTIFSEVGHVSRVPLAQSLEGRQDVHAVIAHLEGNPVGFKVGYRHDVGVYFSKAGGILKEYRHLGMGRRMHALQHGFARSRGYHRVFFHTFNHFKAMMRFGLASGFLPMGAQRQAEGAMAFTFSKTLDDADEPGLGTAPVEVRVESVGPQYHSLAAELLTYAGSTLTESLLDAELAGGAHAAIFMAFVNDKPAGVAVGHGMRSDRTVYRVAHWGVPEGRRGSGIESALAHRLVSSARSQGYARVSCESEIANIRLMQGALDADFDFVGIRHDIAAARSYILLECSTEPHAVVP